ncbi:hypothetical protein OEZ86_002653 [Tetradesmus obliquus]|nr:hypothetical protein OEZ86_002653 [Tetradesmus obliquus]
MDDSDVEFQDEWEEVEHPAALAGAAEPANGDITINLKSGADEPDEADGRKRKVAPGRTYTKQEREGAVEVHRVHALCLLAHALLHDQAASSNELQALLLSMLPAELLDAASAAATSEDPSAAAWLPGLLHWLHRSFTPTAVPHIKPDPQQAGSSRTAAAAAGRGWQHEVLQDLGLGAGCASVQQQLLGCVADRRGSCEQLAALLVAALRGVGFLTRSVWSLEPLPVRPAAVEALLRGKSLTSSSSKARTVADPAAAAAAAAAAAGTMKRGKKRPGALAELIHKGASPAALKAAAQQAAAATPKGWLWAPNPTGLGLVPRVWSEVYIGSSSNGRWLHVDGQLGCWDQPGVVEGATARQQPLSYVVACQAGAPKDVTSRYAANFTATKKWRDEAWQAAQPPSTIEGFKAHPLYVLQRHIPQKQALVPGAAKLGLHKGEPYYSRADLQDLHTRPHWRRLGRDTEPWEPPPAVDGKVPRNEHGNVEVPPFALQLPKGTRHIALPGAAAACRSLGIDYAPALVGFDVQGGRNLPKIVGVVVCEEFEEAVVQLHLQRQADKAAAEQQRQRREVEAAWRRLLGNMWTRLQLQRNAAAADAAAADGSDRGLSEGVADGSDMLDLEPPLAQQQQHELEGVEVEEF